MELIKKIKQAETDAKEIIEKAKIEAANRAEDGKASKLEALTEADRERKQSIAASVTAAESEGLSEVETLKKQAEGERLQLRERSNGKMSGAVTKVMEYLKG